MEAPIPQPRLDDDEDVHWALSTAVALWGRSEHAEALKWLRRAAEQASDVNADKRALELFKAAAEVANLVAKGPSTPPPAPASAEVEIAVELSAPTPLPSTPRPPPVPPPRHPPRGATPAPAAAAPGPRPPSVPAPAMPRPVSFSPPAPPVVADLGSPRLPAPQPRSVPPPAPPSSPRQQMPARPVVPQVTAPTRPVAIADSKPLPQAVPPKRRRSFTGEARPGDVRPAEKAHTPHKRRRTHTGDDLHLPPRGSEHSTSFDDLDEDTRVISVNVKERPRDEIAQALDRLRSAPAPVIPPPAAAPAPVAAPLPALAPHHVAPVDHGYRAAAPAPDLADARPAAHDGPASSTSPGTSDWQPNDTVSPIAATPAAPAPTAHPTKRLDTLPALRVAVLGTGIAGEVRLISLDAAEPAPPGAAVALLVPMSGADGEAVARLFGAID